MPGKGAELRYIIKKGSALIRQSNQNSASGHPVNQFQPVTSFPLYLIEQKAFLSKKSVSICRNAGLFDFYRINEYFNCHRTFRALKSCGLKSDKELIAFCKKYSDYYAGESASEYNNPSKKSDTPVMNLTLNILHEKGQLSNRATKVCRKAGLFSSAQIVEYYLQNGSFMERRNCGIITNLELEEFCKKCIQEAEMGSFFAEAPGC